jgi:hypothetical protein
MITNETITKTPRFELGNIVRLGLIAGSCALILCGCSSVRPSTWWDRLPYKKLSAAYDHAQLKRSNTLDVLGAIRDPQYKLDPNALGTQLLSQSDTTIALSGQSKNLYKTWCTLFVFDEHTMTATRKYFFCTNEKTTISQGRPKRVVFPPKRTLIFDSHIVLQPELLSKSYATDEARQIATLEQVAATLKSDMQQLGGNKNELAQGNKLLSISSMMMNQTFEAVVRQLQESPGLARQLDENKGVQFNHISLGKGRVRMLFADDTVLVRIRIGAPLE